MKSRRFCNVNKYIRDDGNNDGCFVLIMSWKKPLFVAGLFFYVISAQILAIPLQEEGIAPFSAGADQLTTESLMAIDAVQSSGTGFSGTPEQNEKNNRLNGSNFFGSDNADIDLNDSIYYEDRKKKDRTQFYSSPNKTTTQTSALHLFDEEETGLSSLHEPLAKDSGFKEKAKDVLEFTKDLKESLTINKEVNFESIGQDTERLMERNLYRQQQQELLAQRGINNNVSQDKYDASLFQAFFSKILTFVLYVVAGMVLMKLVFMFVSWQRKINRYQS